MFLKHGAVVVACLLVGSIGWFASGAEPPVIPVGADAYGMWDRWAYQRIGARAYMRSTYDRRGGNEAADASHFLYQLADDDNVTLTLRGRGCFILRGTTIGMVRPGGMWWMGASRL